MSESKIEVNVIYYIGDCAEKFPNNLECITTKDFKTWLKEHNKFRLEEGATEEYDYEFLVKPTVVEIDSNNINKGD
jgi:hypothetical protein